MAKYVDEAGLARFYNNLKDRNVRLFNTVADMQSAIDLSAGMTCRTNGFQESGDGGAAYYMIASSGEITCANGLYATKIETLPTMSGFSDSSANNLGIFKCVKSWLDNNDKLYYGNVGNPNSYIRTNGVNALVTSAKSGTEVDGKYPLDCMSFVTMCLLGIGFEESIFGDGSNKAKYPRSSIRFLSDEFYRYSHHQSGGAWSALESNEEWTRVTTWQFAEYLNDRGLYYKLDSSNSDIHGKLRIGDIVFFKSTDTQYADRFEQITHVGIYCGIGRFGHHIICDCSEADVNYPVSVSTHETSDFAGYARIPVGTGYDYCCQSVAKPHNALVKSEVHTNERAIIWLDRPVESWGTYLIRYVVTIQDASLLNTTFPAIKIRPFDYIYARYTNNAYAPTFELGKPKYLETTVCLSPQIYDIESIQVQQYLSLEMHPYVSPTDSERYSLRVLEVIPIIGSEPDTRHDGVWVPPIEADTLQDAVDSLNTALGNVATTYTALSGKVLVTIGDDLPILYTFKFVRPRNTDRLTALYDFRRTGVARQDVGGNVTYTTYTTSSPVPFEWYM